MSGSIEDEILQRALEQLQQENLSGRVRGALEPAVGKQPENPNQLLAQGYADQAREGLGEASHELQEAVNPAIALREAALPQLEDEKYSKYKK
jgi:uncharacterized membrane protein YheB (UPF0754 family)